MVAIGNGATSTFAERIIATAIDGLTLAETHANIALEANVVTRWELEGIESCEQAVCVAVVFPFAEDARIGRTTVLVSYDVLVFDAVLHRFGDAAACEASIDCCCDKQGRIFSKINLPLPTPLLEKYIYISRLILHLKIIPNL